MSYCWQNGAMSNHEREFILAQDVTEDEKAKAHHYFDRPQQGVLVELTAGGRHRYLQGEYQRHGDNGSGARFRFGSSYEVHPSGALAVIAWRVWSEGWPAGTNDTEEIVATYAPHQWSRVSGRCAVDPHREVMQQRNRETLSARRSESLRRADAED